MSNNALSVMLADTHSLYQAYMPFLKNGGVFIPTEESYRLGDTVSCVLRLPDESVTMSGQIAWITPATANQREGVGLHFEDTHQAVRIRSKIEHYLSEQLNSDKLNYTL